MKDKASKKTEEEVLDQTFGGDQTFDGFDEEMASQNQDQTQEGGSKPEKKKSSGSSNTLLFVGGGVAALVIIGYMFVIKPMTQQSTAPARPTEVAVEAPVTPPVPPVVQQPTATPPVVSQERQTATDFLTGRENQQAQVPVVQQQLPVIPDVPVVPPPAIIQPQVPVVPTVPVNADPVVSNATSSAVVEELGRRFETQNQQFRIALDEVGTKVSNLERFRDEQLGINKNVEERLSKLEGQKTSPKEVVNKSSNVTVKKPVVRVNRVKPVKEVESNGNILVDKSDIKSTKKEVKEPAVEYNVHSIYGSRVWLKNADGSLSTFTTGDKLPSGELIKSIDDEKFSLTTDKRTIQKK